MLAEGWALVGSFAGGKRVCVFDPGGCFDLSLRLTLGTNVWRVQTALSWRERAR